MSINGNTPDPAKQSQSASAFLGITSLGGVPLPFAPFHNTKSISQLAQQYTQEWTATSTDDLDKAIKKLEDKILAERRAASEEGGDEDFGFGGGDFSAEA